MPRLIRTVIPRIRKSIEERGLVVSLFRSLLLPLHLLREHRQTRRIAKATFSDGFDEDFGVNTEGDFDGWTYLSDLNIESPNWIRGNNYAPIEQARFRGIMSSLQAETGGFVFIDFGSGKGRALLMASEFPFSRVIGLEFAPELHQIAEENIRRYRSTRPGSVPIEAYCIDFLDYQLPPEPSMLFFFDPCDQVVLKGVLRNLEASLTTHPRRVCVVHVAPTDKKEALLDAMPFLTKELKNAEYDYCVYRSIAGWEAGGG